MKLLVILISLFITILAKDHESNPHELFLTTYYHSVHWTKNDETGKEFNDTHKAYGAEYIYHNNYSLTYNHFINSRGKDVDVYGAGYLFKLYEQPTYDLGFHLIGGYQEGYCLNGFLSSSECTQGKDDTSVFILPMLYYKQKYLKIDLFSNGNMLALRINIKLYDLFE